MTDPRPDLDDIREALGSLSRMTSKPLAVRYAEMFLREARHSKTLEDEALKLDRAEQQLGRALIASAYPAQELSLAYTLTQRARSEATG